ncbi:MAG TPA: fibronectin type III domain-containing protein [Propionicimonas sp.]|jgi:endonuclease/exonuclease/phosphatase family metal-dependent hydrolase
MSLLTGLLTAAPASADPQQLAAPTSMTVSQRSTMAVVTWSAVPDAAGYAIDYDTSPSFITARNLTSPETIAVLTDLDPSTSYYVRVAAVDGATKALGPWAAASNFTTGDREFSLPAPVLTATSDTSTSLTLEWNKVGPRLHYEVALGKDARTVTTTQQVTGLTTVFDKLEKTTKYYLSARAVNAGGDPVTAWSAPVPFKTPESLPLRVGSYNIRNGTINDGGNWTKRRHAVADTVAGQHVAVLGLQEATWNIGGYPAGQYADLAHLLGRSWKSTTYVGNAGPEGTRIIYDSSQVTMLRQGYQKLAGSHANGNWRYATWAEFRQLSTGKRFFFANTHLLQKQNTHDYNSRKSSAAQLVRIVARNNPENLPTIIVGDLNSHKFRNPENAPYKIITAAGYIDPLDNIDDWRGGPRGIAEKRIDADLFTINLYKRKAMRGNYATGVMVDQIFVTPMRVSEWQTVARLDSSGRFIGTIPSDHNMIRATVYLP